jgi:hypothetical protein
MIRRQIPALVLIASLTAAMAACNKNSTTAPTVATTPTVTMTESFTGTLTINGANSTFFSTLAAGTVTATIKSLAPDSGVTIGLALGNWTGSACQLAVTNDAALIGNIVTGSVGGVSSVCARVYDVGKLAASTTFTIELTHP